MGNNKRVRRKYKYRELLYSTTGEPRGARTTNMKTARSAKVDGKAEKHIGLVMGVRVCQARPGTGTGTGSNDLPIVYDSVKFHDPPSRNMTFETLGHPSTVVDWTAALVYWVSVNNRFKMKSRIHTISTSSQMQQHPLVHCL